MNKKLKKSKKGGSVYNHNYMIKLFETNTNINDYITLYADEKKLMFVILDTFYNKEYNNFKTKLIKYIYGGDFEESSNSKIIYILEKFQIPYCIMILFMHIHLYAKCQKIINIIKKDKKLTPIIKDFNSKMCQIIIINKENIENTIKYIKKMIFATCVLDKINNNDSFIYLLMIYDLHTVKQQLYKNSNVLKFIETRYKSKENLNKFFSKKKNTLLKLIDPKYDKNKLNKDIKFANSLGNKFFNKLFNIKLNDFINIDTSKYINKNSLENIKEFESICKKDFISKANNKFTNNLFQNNTINVDTNDLNIKNILDTKKPKIELSDIINVINELTIDDDHSLLNDLINLGIFDENIHIEYSDYILPKDPSKKDPYYKCFESKILFVKQKFKLKLKNKGIIIYNFDTEEVDYTFRPKQKPNNLYRFKNEFSKLIADISKDSKKVNNYILIDDSDIFIPFTGYIPTNSELFKNNFNKIINDL